MKQVFSLILGAIFLVGLCACGAGESVPTWQEQYDLGIRYLSEGNYEEAIIAFTAAIEIDPKQAPAYIGRGDAYVLSGETEENLTAAKADYEKAIELDEVSVDAYLKLSELFIRREEYESALAVLQIGVEKTKNQRIIDKLEEIDRRINFDTNIQNEEPVANCMDKSYWEKFSNCEYSYDGFQVYIIYTDKRVTSTMQYTMESPDNSVITCAVLGLDSAVDNPSGSLYISDWSISEFDSNGLYIKTSYFDRHGNIIDS